jgi:dolichol-phosphate mannosyltransferase
VSTTASVQGGRQRVLLFIPMYNCAKQIARVLDQLTPDIRRHFDGLIIVDNGSTDGGRAAAVKALSRLEGLPAKLLLNDGNYGLGGSHKVAFDYALSNDFDYLVVLHGDDQGSISDIAPLIARGEHLALDCLLGARFMKGSHLRGYSAVRTFGNLVFNALYSIASGTRIHDLGSGLNLYALAAFGDREYLRCADDLTFNYHMILRSIAARQRIRFFPLEWREDDQISNVKLVRQSLRVLSIAVRYALQRNRYLADDYSAQRGQPYSFSVEYDSCAGVTAP